MIVRTARPTDCSAIAALHADSWRATYRQILADEYLDRHVGDDRLDLWEARFAKFDDRLHHVAVATSGDDASDASAPDVTGFVCVLLDEEPEYGALLDNLHVAPTRHGGGIGRRLMADAAAWVAAMRPGWSMHLWVYQANARTVDFYRVAGGEEVDQRVIVTPAGNRAAVLRLEWRDPERLASTLVASLDGSTAAMTGTPGDR